MYQNGGSIKQLLDKVADQTLVLPAIQREFVWKPEQICQLFDSLLQGYPVGTFLYWKIKPEHRSDYQFYEFVQNYHQRDANHCVRLENMGNKEFTAVLDGQQRISSLNIGLRGCYHQKIAGKWWSSNDAFPEKHLYINLFGMPDEEGNQYQFEFLTKEKATVKSTEQYWFKVSNIFDGDIDELQDILVDELVDELGDMVDKEQRSTARKLLRKLNSLIHDKPVISYYEEADQSLEKVLNIFIRMNSGGTPLSYSDLLLSIAVAQWDNLDAREEIHSLVDELNQIGDGFSYSKDLVLKAGLMLSDIGSVGFKVENFNKENMSVLEDKWDSIKQALTVTTQLFASFGFNAQNLRADSALLPVAYYIYHQNHDESYLSKSMYAQDRANIRLWLVKSLLKASGIWGSGLDTLLTGIRTEIKNSNNDNFPIQAIENLMVSRGKSLKFEAEEIDELVELEYGNKRTFALLSVLFFGFDFSHHFHIDHIYPKGLFNRPALRKLGLDNDEIEQFIQLSNKLPNLQLLEGSINNEKRQKCRTFGMHSNGLTR
ncbi:DUF262 domain-containing protein [Shewanella japonica]|uniref:GmrSD restriction endonucleases N-terminal domain-containing protein n=1 Tax=Shewanella japonica TaxID=93973 RepID=A0ABM6JMP0_9GAMM|nr:DUF262 domain-containing protein [Shewanella japonica]ARD23592.1 hypothetical protein SJ2017_3333 [Shewanella japonica]